MCFYSLQQEELEIILPRKTLKLLTVTDFLSGFLRVGGDGCFGSSVNIYETTNNESRFMVSGGQTVDHNVCLSD